MQSYTLLILIFAHISLYIVYIQPSLTAKWFYLALCKHIKAISDCLSMALYSISVVHRDPPPRPSTNRRRPRGRATDWFSFHTSLCWRESGEVRRYTWEPTGKLNMTAPDEGMAQLKGRGGRGWGGCESESSPALPPKSHHSMSRKHTRMTTGQYQYLLYHCKSPSLLLPVTLLQSG